MGLFDRVDDLFGGGSSGRGDIKEAARIQAEAADKGIGYIDPWYQAGLQGLDAQQSTNTPEGMDAMLARIFGTDGYEALHSERTQDVKGMLGAGGLTRSGDAIEAGAAIPADLGFAIEQLLRGRNDQSSRQGMASAFSIGDLLSRSAEATASGILGQLQSDNMRDSSRDSMWGNLAGSAITAAGAYYGGKA